MARDKVIAEWRKKASTKQRSELVEYDIDCLFNEIDLIKKYLKRLKKRSLKKQ